MCLCTLHTHGQRNKSRPYKADAARRFFDLRFLFLFSFAFSILLPKTFIFSQRRRAKRRKKPTITFFVHINHNFECVLVANWWVYAQKQTKTDCPPQFALEKQNYVSNLKSNWINKSSHATDVMIPNTRQQSNTFYKAIKTVSTAIIAVPKLKLV